MFYHNSTDSLHAIHEKVMGAFSAIYCVSPEAQRAVIGFYPQFADRIRCLENIVNVEKIKTKARETIVIDNHNRCILCSCGRISKEKGFDLAVEAARLLKERGLSFLWYFVGDGPERKSLEELIATYSLQENIVFTGMQENPYPYIKACDIYVQPSYEEAQGLSIIEAQVLLRPVVSTRTAGAKSLIQNGVDGILTDITPSALADGIERLMNDETTRHRMQTVLQSIDYAQKEKEFKKKWAELLSDTSRGTGDVLTAVD